MIWSTRGYIMPRKIQIFELEGGGKVAVEVEAAPGEEERIASTKDVIVEEIGQKFSNALGGVQKAAAEVLSGFRSKLAPDELELAFGLKFSGKFGVVLVSTDAEATFTVKAKWTNKT
jgi:hypothetical protein